jgi:phosphate transporter
MKFSHTLSLNANPDWINHYIDYAGLKKVINDVSASMQGGVELSALQQQQCRQTFLEKLEQMVTSIRDFYYEKLAEMDNEFSRLRSTMENFKSVDDNNGSVEMSPLLKHSSLRSVSELTRSELEDLRRQICDLFTKYHNLQTYASLNCTAVKKILKKYDKVMNDHLKETHLEQLQGMLPFWEGTPDLEQKVDFLKHYFSYYFCNGDSNEALRKMNLMVREFVTFQRHSVWLDVVQDQRKQDAAQTATAKIGEGEKKPKSAYRRFKSSSSVQSGIISVLIFLGLLWSPGVFDDDPIKRNALALFVFVTLLWATEAMPLFVTSLLVPFLAVVLRIQTVDGTRLDAHAASKHVFASMFSHVIMLLIGGFSIAAALSKHNIAKMVASSISRRCGSGIRTVLLVNMFIATIASMWISNVAAPVLCYSLIQPILKASGAEKSRAGFGSSQQISADQDHRLCCALVMGIALASNVGGMASPISSPQNLFAIEYTPIGWLPWFAVSIPLCITLNLIIWAWLVFCYRLPAADSTAVSWALQRDRSGLDPFTAEQYYVIAVSVGVVILWCGSVELAGVTGEMGVLGIVPFVLFFGTGILSKEDLNNFLWSVVILAMGGLVLGDAIKDSGLLDVIAIGIAGFIEHNSLSLWGAVCIFTSLILVCTTFVSHTVGAIVVLPIAHAVGSRMEIDHSKELVFAGALACSAAMGLPVSGFPNMTAVSVEDNLGNRYLTTKDFLKFAIPASIFSWVVIVTLAYVLILEAVQMDEH